MTDLLGMKAVSIHQPYAGLITIGAKTIETRSYPTKHRGPIVICSTQRWHPQAKWVKQTSTGHAATDERWSDRLSEFFGTDLDCVPGAEWTEDHLTGEYFWLWFGGWQWRPGRALGVAELVDCLPVVHKPLDRNGEQRIFNYGDGKLWRTRPERTLGGPMCIDDQLPRGDFSPGNYGWMLENFQPFGQSIPVKGQQQIWTIKDSNLRAIA